MTIKGVPWTQEQVNLVTRTVAKGATPDELSLFFLVAKRAGLDVFTKQVHFVKRKVKQGNDYVEVGTVQTGIDGYRAIAEKSGQLAGIDDVVYDLEGDDYEHPNKATVTVWRMVSGQRVSFTASARWSEYVQTYYNKTKGEHVISGLWAKMPYLMLGKCAEALALRKAFPNDLSGIYTHEEMDQAAAEVVDAEAKPVEEIANKKAEATALMQKAKPVEEPTKEETKAARLMREGMEARKETEAAPVDVKAAAANDDTMEE